jgi:hypothetical protein
MARENTDEKLTPKSAMEPPFSESWRPNNKIKANETSGNTGIIHE